MARKTIDEVIADAMAEEEVTIEQELSEEKTKEGFKDFFKEQFKEAIKGDSKIIINLSEYVMLKQKEIDLDRILSAITDNLELGYNNKYLSLKYKDKVVDAIKVLYPEIYDHFLAVELVKLEHEEEGE